MKQIQPVVFPLNLGTATILNAYCINDNLIRQDAPIDEILGEMN
jgi:hypothetical protein